MISLIVFVALFMIGTIAFEHTQGSGLHHPVEWLMDLGVGGALLSLAVFEAARGRFPARSRVRQLVWPLVPLLSLGLLAFVPFLWLALVRRRAGDWTVLAAYLAVVATLTVAGFLPPGTAGTFFLYLEAGLAVIAPLHVALAFSPAAGVPSWREARAARHPAPELVDT
jgi:hypothetical protein